MASEGWNPVTGAYRPDVRLGTLWVLIIVPLLVDMAVDFFTGKLLLIALCLVVAVGCLKQQRFATSLGVILGVVASAFVIGDGIAQPFELGRDGVPQAAFAALCGVSPLEASSRQPIIALTRGLLRAGTCPRRAPA